MMSRDLELGLRKEAEDKRRRLPDLKLEALPATQPTFHPNVNWTPDGKFAIGKRDRSPAQNHTFLGVLEIHDGHLVRHPPFAATNAKLTRIDATVLAFQFRNGRVGSPEDDRNYILVPKEDA